jgi:hypothetical protein
MHAISHQPTCSKYDLRAQRYSYWCHAQGVPAADGTSPKWTSSTSSAARGEVRSPYPLGRPRRPRHRHSGRDAWRSIKRSQLSPAHVTAHPAAAASDSTLLVTRRGNARSTKARRCQGADGLRREGRQRDGWDRQSDRGATPQLIKTSHSIFMIKLPAQAQRDQWSVHMPQARLLLPKAAMPSNAGIRSNRGIVTQIG